MIQGSDIRRLVIQVSAARGTGHVGSALSVCEIMAAIFNSLGEDDRFVLSKGHAALAYYAALHLEGMITKEELFSYCQDGSGFGVHPEIGQPMVNIATGSLGMGLSLAAGMALAGRHRKVFCLCSDAEMDEGSFWEAVMFGAQHKLNNLLLIIDKNNSQALGKKDEISDTLNVLTGWHRELCLGHEQEVLEMVINHWHTHPQFISAHTVMAKGIPTLEGKHEAHYLPLTPAQIEEGLKGISK